MLPIFRKTVWATLFFASSCFAENITLVVWVREDEPALTQAHLDHTIEFLQNHAPELRLRTLVFDRPKNQKNFQVSAAEINQRVSELALNPTEDVIVNMVMATHGLVKDGKTILEGFGNFNASGSDFGGFGDLLDALMPYFSNHLSILLHSCSTLTGTEIAAVNRVEGIYRYLNRHKSLELKVWGATKDLVAKQNLGTSLNGFFMRRYLGTMGAINSILAVATYAKETYEPGSGLQALSELWLLTNTYTFLMTYFLFNGRIGDSGRLIHITENGIHLQPLRFYSEEMIHKTLCNLVLHKQR